MTRAEQPELPVLLDLSAVTDETEHLTSKGKKKSRGGPPQTTREERVEMRKNKGSRGSAKPGAHLDRVDIGG